MKIYFQVILFILTAIASTFCVCEETIKIVTEEYPPYSYSENWEVHLSLKISCCDLLTSLEQFLKYYHQLYSIH